MLEVNLTEIKVTDMSTVDGSASRRYSALVNGQHRVMYATDGFFHPHITLEQWAAHAAALAIEKLKPGKPVEP